MDTVTITSEKTSVECPGDLALRVEVAGKQWVGVPVAIDAPGGLPKPHADESWFSVGGLPLPVILNVDGTGGADLTVHVAAPVGISAGEYKTRFTAGYGVSQVTCPVFSISVVQVVTPRLTGLTIQEAETTLAAAKLRLGAITGVQGSDSRVAGQEPTAGKVIRTSEQVGIEVKPPAMEASAVQVINCTIFEYDLWIHDRTSDAWTRWPGSPLAKSSSPVDCPPPGAPVATIELLPGHYYEVEGAWQTGSFTPGWPGNWQLPGGTLVGSASSPAVQATIEG